MMKNFSCLVALVFFTSSLAASQEERVSKTFKSKEIENSPSSFSWPGYYLKKSELCTSPRSGGSCSEQFSDCLKIEPRHQGYLVELSSTQAGQHVCFFSLQMEVLDGALFYKTKYGSVLVVRNGESLEVLSKGIDPTALGLGFCGAHADIDELKFPLTSKSNIISACGNATVR